MFYPDFLWWVKNTVWAIDPTGKFILQEKVRTKLMAVPLPLRIALVTRGKLDANYSMVADGGWSLLRFRTGNAAPETFDSIDDIMSTLIDES
jgi:type III restriction enzyme